MLITDLSRVYREMRGSRTRRILACWLAPGFQAIKVYRFGHWLEQQGKITRLCLLPLCFFLERRILKNWGIAIAREAQIGTGFMIYHFGSIFIGPSVIGRNVNVGQDVTIGSIGAGPRKGVPAIGDNVHISPGAKIVGNIKVGNNVRIGDNAVVQRNVPDNALVEVRPAQVVIFPTLYATWGDACKRGLAD
jgi:serine O-acetyltransferase